MRLEEKNRALFRSGHPETESGGERLRQPVEVKPVKGAKPGDKVVRIIRRIASRTRKRRRGWLGHLR